MLVRPQWCPWMTKGCKGKVCALCRARKVVWGLKMNREAAISVPDQQTWRKLDELCPAYRAKCERGGENGKGNATYMPCSVCRKYACKCGPFEAELYKKWDELEYDSGDDRCVTMYEELQTLSVKKEGNFLKKLDSKFILFHVFYFISLIRFNRRAGGGA